MIQGSVGVHLLSRHTFAAEATSGPPQSISPVAESRKTNTKPVSTSCRIRAAQQSLRGGNMVTWNCKQDSHLRDS